MLPVTCSFILALYFYLCILSKLKVSAMSVNFKPCDGVAGTIKSLDLSPCTEQPCVFNHGVNATVTLSFTPGSNSESLKTEVYGLIAGVPIRFPMENPDACSGCGLTCPIESGVKYVYHNTLPVLKQYPSLKVVVKWQLVGDNNEIAACVLFPIEIQSNDSNHLPQSASEHFQHSEDTKQAQQSVDFRHLKSSQFWNKYFDHKMKEN